MTKQPRVDKTIKRLYRTYVNPRLNPHKNKVRFIADGKVVGEIAPSSTLDLRIEAKLIAEKYSSFTMTISCKDEKEYEEQILAVDLSVDIRELGDSYWYWFQREMLSTTLDKIKQWYREEDDTTTVKD